MRNLFQFLLLAAVIAYVLSPVDAVPGPADDLLMILLGTAARAHMYHEQASVK